MSKRISAIVLAGLAVMASSGELSATVQSVEERCGLKNPTDGSALCAQWVAARAAQESAEWSRWALYMSAAASIGVLLTLIFTARTTRYQYILSRSELERAARERRRQRPEILTKVVNCFVALEGTKDYFSAWIDFSGTPEPIQHLHVDAHYALEINHWAWEPVERVRADFNAQQNGGVHIKFVSDLTVNPDQIRDPAFVNSGVSLKLTATYRDYDGEVYQDILQYDGTWTGEQIHGNNNGVPTLLIKPVLSLVPRPIPPPEPRKWWHRFRKS